MQHLHEVDLHSVCTLHRYCTKGSKTSKQFSGGMHSLARSSLVLEHKRETPQQILLPRLQPPVCKQHMMTTRIGKREGDIFRPLRDRRNCSFV